ncbi:MAG TPA: amino acid ABC transporter substrate-binding protein [Burkholderiaceae bacterium]|jgi:ABC-type amino acid transport substrate-binding protein|nr:amino acid ABC transporter substrate-binding protein [Burkholderiaceae bacterium]
MQTTFTQALQWLATRAAVLGSLLCVGAVASAAGTLDKIKDTGKLTLGYSADARPFSYTDAGKPAGYGIELCNKVADALKSDLKLGALAVEFVPLSRDEAFRAIEQGRADVLCGAVPTLERRKTVDFSIPIILSGTGVAIRSDAPMRLVQALSGVESALPIWRGSTDQAPQRVVLAVVGGAPLEKALASRLKERRIVADVTSVKDVDAGLQALRAGTAQAFFFDRALLLDAVARQPAGELVVLDRIYRREIVALAMRRDDDDLRLAVDRALSQLYRSQQVNAIYAKYFGAPTAGVLDFFQLVALPD